MWLDLIIGVVALAVIAFLFYIIKRLNSLLFYLWLKDNRKKELNQIFQNGIGEEISDDLDILIKESKAEYKQWLSNKIKSI